VTTTPQDAPARPPCEHANTVRDEQLDRSPSEGRTLCLDCGAEQWHGFWSGGRRSNLAGPPMLSCGCGVDFPGVEHKPDCPIGTPECPFAWRSCCHTYESTEHLRECDRWQEGQAALVTAAWRTRRPEPWVEVLAELRAIRQLLERR
jgi:hypothetical protein